MNQTSFLGHKSLQHTYIGGTQNPQLNTVLPLKPISNIMATAYDVAKVEKPYLVTGHPGTICELFPASG